MGLEAVPATIADLNAAWPLDGDPRSEGNDHIQRIKTALQLTFPNINGAVTATVAQLNLLTSVTGTNVLAALSSSGVLLSVIGLRNNDYGTASSISPSYNTYNMVHVSVNSGPLTITVSGTKADGRNLKIFVNNNTGAALTVNWSGLGSAQYIPNSGASTSIPVGYTLFDIVIINGREQITVLNETTLS